MPKPILHKEILINLTPRDSFIEDKESKALTENPDKTENEEPIDLDRTNPQECKDLILEK